MEPVLIKNAAERGALISFNTEYLDHSQDKDGVTVRFRDVRSGTEFTQRARFLLGFDGARSKIAEQIGLPFEGELARAGTAYILFNADLSKYVAHRPSILHWIFNSKAGFGEIGMGLLRAIRPWGQWIAGWGFDMSQGEPDISDDVVLEQIRTLVGDPELTIDIVSRSFWYVNQQWAEHYQSGRVFCGGDAVHRHPPSSGLGSNTSMQDAFNLAWKIAYAAKGYAGPGLLESYSPERVPVGRQIVARANQSRKDYAGLREWFDPTSDDPVTAGLAKLKAPSSEARHCVSAYTRHSRSRTPSSMPTASNSTSVTPRLRWSPTLKPVRRYGDATGNCTCRPPLVLAPSCHTPGWSARTVPGSRPSMSPARDR